MQQPIVMRCDSSNLSQTDLNHLSRPKKYSSDFIINNKAKVRANSNIYKQKGEQGRAVLKVLRIMENLNICIFMATEP